MEAMALLRWRLSLRNAQAVHYACVFLHDAHRKGNAKPAVYRVMPTYEETKECHQQLAQCIRKRIVDL